MNLPSPEKITLSSITPAIWDALSRKRVTPEEVHRRCPAISSLSARWELDRAHERRKDADRQVRQILSTAVPVDETPTQQEVAFYKRSTFNV